MALAEEHVAGLLLQGGDAREAVVHRERSLQVYQELLRLDPESADRRRDVAIGLVLVANLTNQLGDLPKAEEAYRNSLALMEILVSQDPQNERDQRIRNSILHPLTDVLYRQGKLVESRRMTEHALLVLGAPDYKVPGFRSRSSSILLGSVDYSVPRSSSAARSSRPGKESSRAD